jgi:hypothetical protein
MIKPLILTAALLATASSAVLAEPHRGDDRDGRHDNRPYVKIEPPHFRGQPAGRWEYQRPYSWCEAKARRLHEYTHQARADRVVTRWEARNIRLLEDDLASSCGGGRWAPERGWYNR